MVSPAAKKPASILIIEAPGAPLQDKDRGSALNGIVFSTWSRHTDGTIIKFYGSVGMPTSRLLSRLVLAILMGLATSLSHATPPQANTATKGNATQGQALFNGKGICHYCHGIDGMIDRKPTLEPDTAAVVARLAASAPDLRNRTTLKLKDNKARFHAIRDGHPGSGMLPDTRLTDQEITDLLTYLAALRQNTPRAGASPY
ncbi:MAG: cytochrome c [Nitrospira sp. NTP2]|nr:cytochrome c [Nitrospira sp. NTP2]RIK60868.1 MAG: hypothetical protein DCC63_01540 [Nitrospira sp.]